jgi:hypothetical protein
MKFSVADVEAVVAAVAIGPALPAVAVVVPAEVPKVAKAVTAPRPKVVVAVPTAEAVTVKVAVVAAVTESVVDADVPKTDPDTTALPRPSKVRVASAPNTTTVVKAESKVASRESPVRRLTPWTDIPVLSETRSRERAVTDPVATARTRMRRPPPPPPRKERSKERRPSRERRRKAKKRPRPRIRKSHTPLDANVKKRRRPQRKMRRPSPVSTLLISKPSRPRTFS